MTFCTITPRHVSKGVFTSVYARILTSVNSEEFLLLSFTQNVFTQTRRERRYWFVQTNWSDQTTDSIQISIHDKDLFTVVMNTGWNKLILQQFNLHCGALNTSLMGADVITLHTVSSKCQREATGWKVLICSSHKAWNVTSVNSTQHADVCQPSWSVISKDQEIPKCRRAKSALFIQWF